MSVWQLLWQLLGRIVGIWNLFGSTEKQQKMNRSVIVKFASRPFVEVDVEQKWSIGQLKEKLSKKADVPVDEIKLIFAGKELDNGSILEEYDLGNQSIIHAVPSLKPTSTPKTDDTPRAESPFFGRRRDRDEAAKRETGFFVFCNSCKGLKRGKLRVRCDACKRGTLTVHQDPCGWDDVLKPGRIEGTCQSGDCKGSVAEFYFKCASHPSAEDETCVSLHQIRYNESDATCLSCMEIHDDILVFTCKDAHVLCVDCFILYCTSRLMERQFVQDVDLGYTLPCPAGCGDSLIEETHHFKLLGDDLYSRYQRFGAEECLLQAGGVLCPVPGCGSGIIPDPDCNRVVCSAASGQGCGFVFCKRCLQGFHLGECTDIDITTTANDPVVFTIDATQAESARRRLEGTSAIRLITKPCPQCRTPTERDGGCMHMVCLRANCGFHWCWVCQCEWNRDCMANHWFG